MSTLPLSRLRTQKIGGCAFSPSQLVSYMGAMQAQDYYGALWAIGLRTGKTEKEVIAAIEAHQIVRTWPQRGTIHYVTPEDAVWMTALSAPRLLRGLTERHNRLEITDILNRRTQEIWQEALRGNKRLTRPAMLELLEADSISTGAGRGYHYLWLAAQLGILYIGPMEGKQQTFGLLADLLPVPRKLSKEDAITELATRYFISHGPATLQDFAWWSGTTLTDLRPCIAKLADALVSEKIDGKEYWSGKSVLEDAPLPEAVLLPGFDEYILGYKDRSAQMKPEYAAKIIPGNNGMFMASLVLRGQVVGMWKHTVKKDRVLIAATMFEPITGEDKTAFHIAADQYGTFVGLPAEIIFS